MGSEGGIRLSSFKGSRPVGLIFGSYTCPPFRAQLERIEQIRSRFDDQVEFFVVYVQ